MLGFQQILWNTILKVKNKYNICIVITTPVVLTGLLFKIQNISFVKNYDVVSKTQKFFVLENKAKELLNETSIC